MEGFKRNQSIFQSLPRYFSNAIRSLPFQHTNEYNYIARKSSLSRRRNGISFTSYNELRKSILYAELPTTIIERTPTKEFSLKSSIDLPLAASSYYILIFLNECSTLVLFNEDHELFRLDLRHKLILIHDVCWSTKLNVFLLAGFSFYTFDPHTRVLSSIEEINLARGERIISLTNDSRFIYVLYSSRSARIECRSLLAPYRLEKAWSQQSFLRHKDLLARCIRINQLNILAITVKQNNGQWRVDLFNPMTFSRFRQSCSLGQSIPGTRNCLLLPYNHLWIVVNNCSVPKQVILLNEHGQIKAKHNINTLNDFHNLCLLGERCIVINSKTSLKLYDI